VVAGHARQPPWVRAVAAASSSAGIGAGRPVDVASRHLVLLGGVPPSMGLIDQGIVIPPGWSAGPAAGPSGGGRDRPPRVMPPPTRRRTLGPG